MDGPRDYYAKQSKSEQRESVSHSVMSDCEPMDCSLPGSPFHGIFQARIVDWVPIPFSQGVFLTQEIKPGSPASQADSLLSEQPREQSKSERECQILYDVICMWNLKYDTNDHSYKTEAD